MNPLEWKISTWLVAAGTLVGSIVAIVQGGPVLADAQPFAYKSDVARQMASAAVVQNVNRMDLLEFQIQTLTNGLAVVLPDSKAAKDTQAVIDKKQRELDLLDCLIKQRNPCVQ